MRSIFIPTSGFNTPRLAPCSGGLVSKFKNIFGSIPGILGSRSLILIFFIGFAAQSQTKMSKVESLALKAKVKTLAASTHSIYSDFVQYKHLDFLDNDIETHGNIAFKSPDLIKWEYVKPFKYSILFKGEKIHINDQGTKKEIDAGSNKMLKQLNKLIINSVKGDMFNEADFKIEYFNFNNSSVVYFSPKAKKIAKYFKAFHITFNDKGDVTEVKMIEPSLDYTKIVFRKKKLNQTLDNALFIN